MQPTSQLITPTLSLKNIVTDDTSRCHQPPWPPSSYCPCHPQCGRISTKMTWRMSDMILSGITTAYHFLIEDNSNWSDTSWCQRPRWSSPPCCPCHPHCRRPPTHMYFMLSDMLQEEEKNDDNRNQYSISHPNWKKIKLKRYIPTATSLVFSS